MALHNILEVLGIFNHEEICFEAQNGEQAIKIIIEDV